ncbi:MAG: DUF1800 domain-containing protein [Blastocatellia bacterium]|nr:DUF1800 domain-containing protein [Blastocatellia bacterium]
MKQAMKNRALNLTVAVKRAIIAMIAVVIAASLVLGTIMTVAANSVSKSSKLTEEQKILHLLNRTGFGPRPGDVERVKRIGINKYIEQQLRPERIDDSSVEARLAGLESLRMTVAQAQDKYPPPQEVARQLGLRRPGQPNQPDRPAAGEDEMEVRRNQQEYRRQLATYYMENGLKQPQMLLMELQAQKIIRAVYSERQLQEVMADFWFNHFNIFWGKAADRYMTTDFEMNAIRPNTLGKFKDLLLATAKSPAMLFYLDNFQSSSPDAQPPGRRGNNRQLRNRRNDRLNNLRQGQRRPADEMERDQTGDPQQMTDEQRRRLRAANQPQNRRRGINENYAREIMELHTLGVDGGYTQKDVQEVARAFTGWTIDRPRQNGSFIFRQFMHDNGEKVVLGQRIPAGGGMKDGEKVIEILSSHPNTAKFISTKLVRRFVSDNPPPLLVDRVAGVYLKTGGDISEMLRAIFTSKEFIAPEAYRSKIKSPFELAVSAIRALGGQTNGAPQLGQFISKMGQPLYMYQAPTGYPDRAEQWVNTGALLERLNFGLALSANRVRGASVDPKNIAPGTEPSDTKRVMDRAIAVLLNGEVSSQTRAILDKQLKEGVPVKGELGRVPEMTGGRGDDSMMAGDEFERRREQFRERQRAGRLGGDPLGLGQLPQSPVDPEIAKVFGLVLGSPEFQRR